METMFTVRVEDIKRLSDQQAVDFFRELLWAEATALGIGRNLINVPTAITVSDGGIDAEVRNVQSNINCGQGIIKPDLTRYQIKTGPYSLHVATNVQKLLYIPKSKNNELQPKIKSCLEQDGTFVIVLFGWDNPEKAQSEYVDSIKEELTLFDEKYENAKIEVWQPNQLMRFFNTFPSLALKIKGIDGLHFQSHQSWTRQDDMQKPFKAGKAQNDFLLALQETLRQNNEALHVHICGEPGIGKTRLVLEATLTEEFSPLVIYCDSANKFIDSNLMNELMRYDNQYSVLLVIDECDFENRVYIWNKLKNSGSRIKLISIYNEHENAHGTTIYYDAPSLSQEQISDIIQEYGIPKDQANRWSEFCSGSPRVAHVIGWNLKNNPEDLLASPDTVNVWKRYIVGGDNPNDQIVQQRTMVLQHIALFKRFGYGSPVIAEATVIAKIIEQADTSITWARFQIIVKALRSRKLLQGENTLYITPKAFHIKLWLDWWETYNNYFQFDAFSANLSERLLEWFYEMFIYAAQSDAATAVVKNLLGTNGPFQNDSYLQTKLGSRFFFALAQASPGDALTCLKRTIGRWNKEQLLEFTTGRREVVWALERITMWKEHFTGAAELLLSLGEAENETWSNNASGVFIGLFSLGTDELAPTQASPQKRLLVLKKALKSQSKERRLLAIHACNKALESQHFYRDVDAEYQGLIKVPDLWLPKTYEELFEAYRQIWQLLYAQLTNALDDEQQLIITILLQRARGLGKYLALADMVIDTVGELAYKPFVDQKKILANVVSILHYEAKELPEHIQQRWEELRDKLSGNDFSSRMKRYVGMNLLEDQFDEQGNQIDQTQSRFEELAQQVIDNPELLHPDLSWLVTEEAQNGYRFGYELGKRDTTFMLLPLLIEAQRKANKKPSAFFLGGYLRVLFEKDQPQWEKQIDLITEDKILRVWLLELVWRSGITDHTALRLIDLAGEAIFDIGLFRYFTAGRVIQTLSEETFQKWIQTLLDSKHPYAVSIVLDLYHTYYVEKESSHMLPEQLTLYLLTAQRWLIPVETAMFDPMDYHNWTEIGKAFIEIYPKKSILLAAWMLEHFGEMGTILDHSAVTQTVLYEITKQYPRTVWPLIARFLNPPLDTRRLYIRRWLHGENDPGNIKSNGALLLIPLEVIWQWVDEDVEQRASNVAGFVPKSLFRIEGQICVAREVLMRYGDRDDVRQEFSANYFTGFWWGPESRHYEEVKRTLLELKEGEENDNVSLWIDEYVAGLDDYIHAAKIREERDAH